MITYANIEDYLEVLGGHRSIIPNQSSPSPYNLFAIADDCPINLARYDVAIIQSMSAATVMGTALTDKQSELAVKLVEKYQRQFATKGLDVAPSVASPTFRKPIRTIDRTKSITVKDGTIVMKFPFDKVLVPAVSSAAKASRGKFTFDREHKVWILAITESNVNVVTSLGAAHGFTSDAEVNRLMGIILEAEKVPYKIELTIDVTGNITVTNAAPSLIRYIESKLGGLTYDNLLKLIDYGPVLGYTIDSDILQAITQEYSPIVLGVLQNRESHVMRHDPLSNGDELLEPIVRYAELVGRWPICIYEPDASNRLRDTAVRLFKPEEILDTTAKKVSTEVDLTGIKCVYFNKLKRAWKHRVPILISTNAMLYGGEKQAMLGAAEKVVYYTATTYDKEAKTIAGKINN